MNCRHRFAAIALALIVAVVFNASLSHAADKKTTIQLRLDEDFTDEAVIEVQPVEAKIWRNKPDKPKKVEWWWESNATSFSEIYWEIRYDPSKEGATANYFGDVDIKCGETRVKVQPDKKPDFPKAEWPYSITVFACKDGGKAQEIATVDPRIIWQD